MARKMAHTNAPSGTTISGPISALHRGVPAVGRYRQLNLRSFARGARRIHSPIVRPYRLPRNGEPEAGAPGLVGDVWLPDLFEALGRNSLSGVGDRYAHRVAAGHPDLIRLHRDVPAVRGCVDGVEKNVTQCAGQRAVVAVHSGQIVVYLKFECDVRRNSAARRVADQLANIYFRGRTIGQPSELGEAPRHAIQSV